VSDAQLGIAEHASILKQGDNPEDYLRRVKLLALGRDDLWYRCGFQEFTRNHLEDAWATWRHCLELSDRYLPQILILTTKRLKAEQLVEKVLPNNPDLLLEVSLLLYPGAGVVKQRRPFMEKARRLLESSPEGMVRRELRVNDRILQGRLEFARYLSEQGKPEEARRELMLVLAQDSKHDAAKVLLSEITRQRR
jgi:tetratricopeptide (TPR) repeat protein